MRKTVLVQAIACALLSSAALQAAVKVEDKTFNTAANMLAYTEFELSGEPLAEAIRSGSGCAGRQPRRRADPVRLRRRHRIL